MAEVGLIRSFIAVAVPPESADLIRAAQERLRAADAGVKWVRPETFHLTLKFLGGVEQERLDAAWRAVSEALGGSPAFRMCFHGVGAFPSLNRARVVWAGITEGAAELSELAERVEQACGHHGFAQETRPFQAHLTLGRVREPGPNPGLPAVIKELAETDLGEVAVTHVLLMKSELTRQGAVYSELNRKELMGEGDINA